MQQLYVYALGNAALRLGSETLSGFVSQKTIALFIYLLCHPYEHPREALAERFWAETTNEQALKNLRTVLSSLQKQLGDFLAISRQSIALTQVESIWFDVQAFEAHLDRAQQRGQRPGSPRQLRNELEAAIALYRGDFLLGLKIDNAPELDNWLSLERERLRGRLANAQLELMKVVLQRGAFEIGIEHGQRLITLEPFWETAYCLLMELYVAANNRTAALQVYETLYSTLQAELDTVPESATTDLYEQIKAGHLSPRLIHQPRPLSNGRYVPVPALIEAVQQRLDDPNCRLLTLVGIGGAGKTSLAQYIADLRGEDYRDGVYFIALESVTGAEFVVQALMKSLVIAHLDERRPALDLLLEQLHTRHCLIVLDNFEHVLAATDLLAEMLATCPYIQLLVTSREQLHLLGEYLIPVNGLPLHSEDSPAIVLFNRAAQQVQPTFEATHHLPAINRIAQVVDGLPLGLVIAAGWVQFLSPEEIATRMEANLDFLTIARRDLPDRHRGISALLRSTWEVLDTNEQQVMMALSVFPAHFDATAAERIAGANLPMLFALVSKSLIQAVEGRYHLHELLRRFTYQQAADAGVVEASRRAHHVYYSAWIDRLYEQFLPPHEQFVAIDQEYHNLWHFDWLPLAEQYQYILKLAKILPDYWIARSYHVREGIVLLRQALPEAQGWLKANAYVRFGRLLAQVGNYAEARDILEEGLLLSRAEKELLLEALALNELKRVASELGDLWLAQEHLLSMIDLYERTAIKDIVALREIFSRAYSNLAVVYLQVGDLKQAEHYGLIGLQKHRDAASSLGEALSLNTLGIIALDQTSFTVARDYFTAALQLAQSMNHQRHQTIFAGNLAEALHRMGSVDEAFQMYKRTLGWANAINNRKTMLNVLEQLASLALDLGTPLLAAHLVGAALALREETGIAIAPRQEHEFAARESRLQAAFSATDLHAHLLVGRAASIEQILSELENAFK